MPIQIRIGVPNLKRNLIFSFAFSPVVFIYSVWKYENGWFSIVMRLKHLLLSERKRKKRERERKTERKREREREGATLRAISLPETPKAQHSTWRYISPKAPAVAAVQARGKHKNQNVSPFTEMEAIFFGLEELVRLVFPSLKNKSNAILKQIKSGRNKIYVSWINS